MLEALKLMVIGLTTVFAVLLIIIGLGKLLIRFVNKYVPEEEKAPARQAAPAAQAIPQNVLRAVELAVSQITGGKGKVEKIEKI